MNFDFGKPFAKTQWVAVAAMALGAASTSARADQYSIFPPTFVPAANQIFTDNVPYELGTTFTTSLNGQILDLRYYLPAQETGSHTGNLWTSSGTLLESVTFPDQPAGTSGWMQAQLASPVNILAGANYVVSVNINQYYADVPHGLDASISNGPVATVAAASGLLNTTVGGFPNFDYNNANYFRDVVFQPVSVPEPAAIGLLALGGMLMLRRRPRKMDQ